MSFSFPPISTDEASAIKKNADSSRVCAVQPAVRNVGVVEPRVVVKIPWAKLKPNFNPSNSSKTSLESRKIEEKSSDNSIELDSPFSTSDVLEAIPITNVGSKKRKTRKENENEEEEEEEEEETNQVQSFSITEKLPEHFRQALRARRCINDFESEEDKHFSNCCKRKKKKKSKKNKRRKTEGAISSSSSIYGYNNKNEENIITFSQKSENKNFEKNTTAYFEGQSHVVNPLKLIRKSISNGTAEEFKIQSDKNEGDVRLRKFGQITFDKMSPAESVETGFSRYKDTCLDFGDLVRQSKLKSEEAVDKNDRQMCSQVDELLKVKSTKKHRHSKCRKHRHHSRQKSIDSKVIFSDDDGDDDTSNNIDFDQNESLTSNAKHSEKLSPKSVFDSNLMSPQVVEASENIIAGKSNQPDLEPALFFERNELSMSNIEIQRRSPIDLLSMPVLSFEEESPTEKIVSQQTTEVTKNQENDLGRHQIGSLLQNHNEQKKEEEKMEREVKKDEKNVESTKEQKEKQSKETNEVIEVDISTEKAATLTNETKTKKVGAKFLVEKETDGKWMYCKVEGCHFWTRKKIRMARHSNSHAQGEDNRLIYQCPDCKLKISSLPKLLRHDRKFHTGFKDYECKICEAEVTDISVHMRVSCDHYLFFFRTDVIS